MTISVEKLLREWDKNIDPEYFNRDPRFSLRAEDYATHGAGKNIYQPKNVLFKPDFTKYGLVLKAARKGHPTDAAVLGFNSYKGVADCLQIQGGHGRYRELAPIQWDSALLRSLISFSREAGLDAVYVVHCFDVNGLDDADIYRLQNRYNSNAERQGFRYSETNRRFVLELR